MGGSSDSELSHYEKPSVALSSAGGKDWIVSKGRVDFVAMSLETDYLLRNINELASALLSLMGLREGEEDLTEIEIEAETHLGMPISMFEGMTQPGLMSFVTMKGGHDTRRMMLLGLVLAARSEMAAEKDETQRARDLRPKSIALLEKAFVHEPDLRTDDTETVLDTLIEDQADDLAVN